MRIFPSCADLRNWNSSWWTLRKKKLHPLFFSLFLRNCQKKNKIQILHKVSKQKLLLPFNLWRKSAHILVVDGSRKVQDRKTDRGCVETLDWISKNTSLALEYVYFFPMAFLWILLYNNPILKNVGIYHYTFYSCYLSENRNNNYSIRKRIRIFVIVFFLTPILYFIHYWFYILPKFLLILRNVVLTVAIDHLCHFT